MSSNNKLIIPTREGYELIDRNAILFGEANGNRCKLQLHDRKVKVSKPLKHIETKLPSEQFIRIHQSFLVNMDAIVKYIKGNGGYVLLSNGHELKVSEGKRENLLIKLGIKLPK